MNRSLVASSLVASLLLASTASAVQYHIIDLGTLGGNSSQAFGVNSAGHVVGAAVNGSGQSHAFFYDGTMHDLGTLGGTQSQAKRVNDHDEIVGWSYVDPQQHVKPFYSTVTGPMLNLDSITGNTHQGFAYDINSSGQIPVGLISTGLEDPYLFTTSTAAPLPEPLSFGRPEGINASGQVAEYSGGGPSASAYLITGATSTLIPGLGGNVTEPHDLNDSAHVVGYAKDPSNNTHAFWFDGTTTHDLGGTSAQAEGINNFDVVVGLSNAAPFSGAFVSYGGGSIQPLMPLTDAAALGWQSLTAANDVNDAGQIVGYGVLGTGQHAFLLTPVPEPASSTLSIVAVVALSAATRQTRRKRRQ